MSGGGLATMYRYARANSASRMPPMNPPPTRHAHYLEIE